MAKLTLTDARLYAYGADLTGMTNSIDLSAEYADLDATTFGSSGWNEHMAGLGSAELDADGFWEAGDAGKVDDATWANIGGLGPWTVCPNGSAVGALAYFMNAFSGEYTVGGEVGNIAPYSANAKSNWPLVRGTIANSPSTARTSSGSGTAIQLGAVATGKHLYAAVHVVSISGTTPSITFTVESDDNSGFSSATTRLSFTAATAVGGQIIRLAGPITDTWYRATWTVSGTSPSVLAVVAIGVA